ncbi:MAG: hypothetical protein ABIP63_06500 [Thermoanaerobaculia bacterium]
MSPLTLPRAFILILALGLPTAAQADWTIGAATGPFVFGNFAERTSRVINGSSSGSTRSNLSASTRAGASIDVESGITDWLGVKLEGSWTRSPLRIKSSGGSGLTFDAGEVSVTSFSLPAVIHLNRHGAFRFQLEAGPSYSLYRVSPKRGGTIPLFEGTRGRWGGTAGGSVSWWLSSRVAIEGRAVDLVTTSPFRREDLASPSVGVSIPKTHNVHTTVGIRYRF